MPQLDLKRANYGVAWALHLNFHSEPYTLFQKDCSDRDRNKNRIISYNARNSKYKLLNSSIDLFYHHLERKNQLCCAMADISRGFKSSNFGDTSCANFDFDIT